MSFELEIKNYSVLTYSPKWATEFERLNKQWIEKYFKMETLDEEMLSQPEEHILKEGGQIFFAITETGECIGTCALKRMSESQAEFTKMAVEENLRGLGVGQRLMDASLEYAKSHGFKDILIISNTSLDAAIHLYKKNGFQVKHIGPGTGYERGDIVLTLSFN